MTLVKKQERNAAFQALKEAVQEGVESGISDRTVREIWAEAEQRHETGHG